MNGKGLLSKTILLTMLFIISIAAHVVIGTARNQDNKTWQLLASIEFLRNQHISFTRLNLYAIQPYIQLFSTIDTASLSTFQIEFVLKNTIHKSARMDKKRTDQNRLQFCTWSEKQKRASFMKEALFCFSDHVQNWSLFWSVLFLSIRADLWMVFFSTNSI